MVNLVYLNLNGKEKKFNFKKATTISEFPSSLRDISISINNENIIVIIIFINAYTFEKL